MSTPRLLLLGADGQVGWEMRRALLPLGEVLAMNRAQADLSDLDGLRALLERERPDVIVNAAAYTAVDKAESEPDLAGRINRDAPQVLAECAAQAGSWLVHYSTDYVFDGLKAAPYGESDTTNPQSVYGRTKQEGEAAITASGCRHLIFRTSWVYAARGSNFAKTMLRLATEHDSLRVVADQVGAPTSAELISDVTAQALHRVLHTPQDDACSGLYHLTAQGSTSWHGYAQHVIAWATERGMALRCGPDAVQPISTAEYPVPAPRPANSRLDCSKLQNTFDLVLPDWRIQVQRMIEELAP